MPEPKIYPCLRYLDAPAAIAWLGRAFGFTELLVVKGEGDGSIAHAELAMGSCVVMLGSARDDAYGQSPRTLGGVTQTVYMAVDDPDALHARAAAAGAEIIRPPADTDYGAREFSCRDPEGHVWSFGTWRP
ncbi:MAG: VOC family protein [Geminicoccaceae bacterium]